VRPAGQLQSLVASYAFFDMTAWPPGRHRGLPDGTLTLVVSLGAPLIVRRAGQADVTAAASIAGLRSGPVEIGHDGTQRGVQVELTPRGARALLGLPAAALAEGVWTLDEVAGRRAAELTGRLADAHGEARQARVLESVLAGWAVEASCPPAVDAFWRTLVGSAGRVPIASIADQLGLSRRYLSQVVRDELGLTPKTAARVVRFSQARQSLRTGRTRNLAETAAVCGYFDQAHLTSDWKQLAGCTPGQWLSQELPFLQDQDRAGRPG
jgi:AraC-like DNA-binding protein